MSALILKDFQSPGDFVILTAVVRGLDLACPRQFQRGTLNANRDAITRTPTWQEDFNYDPTGNWHGATTGYRTQTNGSTDLDQNRAHNRVNEITDITETTGPSWPTPAHDRAGNMTSIPQPNSPASSFTCKWDAWNRLVEVNHGQTNVATYRYDGLNRRVTKTTGGTVHHYYYSSQWQILEERLGASATADRQFVWGPRHLDDLVLRDRDTERLYALADSLHVTAVANASGAVQERYGYDAFGKSRVMDANFATRVNSDYDLETRFDGYRFDPETGAYQVRYRYLHSLLGRWLSRDPVLEIATFYESSRMLISKEPSLYSAFWNDPINKVDRDGRAIIAICIVLGVVVFGAGCGKPSVTPKAPKLPSLSADCAKDPQIANDFKKLKNCDSDSGDGSAECATICECICQGSDEAANACVAGCDEWYKQNC